MADYYPLIAKAVAGLDKNTGEIRRALYERARSALVGQLRSIDPPLNEGDITRERLALEEAIRKVETEASKRKPETPEETQSSLSDEGLRGFRAVVAEAENLGSATAEANRAAHEVHEAIPADRPVAEEAPSHAEPELPLESSQSAEPAPLQPTTEEPTPLEPALPADFGDAEPPPFERTVAHEWHAAPAAAEMPAEEELPPVRSRAFGRVVKSALLLLVIAGIAVAGYWQRDELTSFVASFRKAPAPQQQAAQQPAPKPKITDRVGGGSARTSPANAPAASVAQKVVLYDEDPANPQGKRYVGSAIWRTETVSPGPGLAPELAIRADVEIPERHMRMTFSLRRNTDKALPASHTIEIMFTVPQDFSEGGINNIPGVLMKQEEQARGAPLSGLAVKVTNGYFLIGLSAVDVDMQRNIEMLKTRDWFDIPLVYTTGKRAILAVEKGDAGNRVFEEAFRTWGQ
jgi:hypothetical protein